MVITGATDAVPRKVTPLSSASGGCNGYEVFACRGDVSFHFLYRNDIPPRWDWLEYFLENKSRQG
jgi:hypothetical protein